MLSLLHKRVAGLALLAIAVGGCARVPRVFAPGKQPIVDRSVVEYPSGLSLSVALDRVDLPTAIAFDTATGPNQNTMILVTGGVGGLPSHVYGIRPDGARFDIYPQPVGPVSRLLGGSGILKGPIGGVAVYNSEIYLAHRDDRGMGVISAINYRGETRTVVGDLPAAGDYSLTDIAFHPFNGRLFFGVGAATNSGVVGLDNWTRGWARKHRDFSDAPAADLKLLGLRFDTTNPVGGLFGGKDVAVTSPFQPFGQSNKLRVPHTPTGKPTAAIYSISPQGGDLRVEAHGLRYPRGLAFTEFGTLVASNQGMEMRGTRPVKDDPDVVLRIPLGGGTWYGWPDFSADLMPISNARFQPPPEMIARSGYPEVSALIDHSASGLVAPDRGTLVRGVFPSLSGASKLSIIAGQAGFDAYRGQILVALAGDRAPFATSGVPLKAPVGYKLSRIDTDTKQVVDFVYNTRQLPAHLLDDSPYALERPIDAKFAPDGSLYIVDMGRVTYDDGRPKPARSTGRVYRLSVAPIPSTEPATTRPRQRATGLMD